MNKFFLNSDFSLLTDFRNLYNNGIREIHDYAFNGTKIDKLYFPTISYREMKAEFLPFTALSSRSITLHFMIAGY